MTGNYKGNIAQKLSEAGKAHKDNTALIEVKSGLCLTFGELDQRAGRYAAYLGFKGIKPGMRVMLMVRPSADFICLTFALFRIGAPVILIDPGMGYRNLLKCIRGVKPDILIGVPQALLFRFVFRKPFRSVKKSFSCGRFFGIPGTDIAEAAKKNFPKFPLFEPDEDSLAAIIFTTGSTGPPKGVRFEHSIFSAQLNHIKKYYRIGPGDIDQPGFPLFGLFSIALGACAVIPDMDPSHPSRVDPAKFISSIQKYKVTYSFGSPAIWNVVSNYCIENRITCKHLQKILMAGAPVPGELITRVFRIMGDEGTIHTPYGATESLPIVSIEGREIVEQTWNQTRVGKGTCVGRPLPGIEVMVIEATDAIIESSNDCTEVETGEIGEIIVKGDVVTRSYENNLDETLMSKITDEDGFWHRIGDVGYVDEIGRLWFCGRKTHRVKTVSGVMNTIPCEAITNEHRSVFRSALVGLQQKDGFELPVMVVELYEGQELSDDTIIQEVKGLAGANPLTREISYVLIHPSFPVDIRHNAKIFREKLKVWAEEELLGKI